MHPYAAAMYTVSSVIKESSTIKPHGNCTKNTSKQKPYLRTCDSVLSEAKDLLSQGKKPSTVYDLLNKKSGGPYTSSSQNIEPRNIRQIYRQDKEVKKSESKDIDELK